MEPIGFVSAARVRPDDDFWGGAESCIELVAGFGPESLAGLPEFSHLEVIFLFHAVEAAAIARGARHPRNNPAWPAGAIFAQRGKSRPNRIGTSICRIRCVEGAKVFGRELAAVDGTPVLDLKPVMAEFLPREPVSQPRWSRELMTRYWLPARGAG